MTLPLWAVFGLISAVLSVGVMLVQERVRLNGFSMAFWNKAACATFMLPLVGIFGAPKDPVFYMILTAQSFLWVISDVIFFDAVTKVGSGLVSRILPVSVILTFFLWFVIDPSLIHTYAQTPVRSALVIGVLFLSVYFSMRLRHCTVSWQAVRFLWFVIFSAVIGPLMSKLILGKANMAQGPFSYVFFQALIMILLWLVYYAFKRPVPLHEFLSWRAVRSGFMVGAFSSLMVASNAAALQMVDNPGLVPAVRFTDTFLILLYYKAVGRKEDSDIFSGLGIVACAAAIVFLKSS